MNVNPHTSVIAAIAASTALVAGLAGTAQAATVVAPKVATSWTSPTGVASTSQVKVTLDSRPITSTDIGAKFEMRITPDSASIVDCKNFQLLLVKDGRIAPITINYYDSGCWTGGVDLDATVTQAMVGGTIRMVSNHTVVGTAKAVGLVGQVTIGSQVTKSTLTVARPTTVTAPAATATPKPTATTTPKPTATATPTVAPTAPVATLDSLPRIPWEGGAHYYDQFPDTKAAGWSDPNHFPVAVWWGGFATDADVKSDKAKGINTYVILNPLNDANLLRANGMSYIGKEPIANMTRHDKSWAGDFLEDEADAWGGDAAESIMQSRVDALPDHAKFRYANYTAMTYSWTQAGTAKDTTYKNLVNNYSDVVSSDYYWYLQPLCDSDDPHGEAFHMPFTKANCRTPQAYGRNQESIRWRDSQDGKLQPTMTFVENQTGGDDSGRISHVLTPGEVKGAAMNTLIHEARGLMWFNQSFGNQPCGTGNAVRAADSPTYPAACKANITAMAEINNLAQSLAPVLNSQSYVWNFGSGVETMLKSQGGAAYIFAMPTDAGTSSGPGTRKFTVPAALKGKKITVVGENRTLPMAADGSFADSFAALTSYHVYKVA